MFKHNKHTPALHTNATPACVSENELERHKQSRAELEISIEETTNQLEKQNNRQARTHEQLIIERNGAIESLKVKHVELKERAEELTAANS